MTSTPSPLGGGMGGLTLGSSLPSSPTTGNPEIGSSTVSIEKSRRYDRQLRLWGDHGQRRLEMANVCLVGAANATGCEVLKSLVLPGIGQFTIVDDKEVTREELGNNFFIDQDSIGQSRAIVARNNLVEMNSEVSGEVLEENLDHILQTRPEFFLSFTLVIATDVAEKSLIQLSNFLWDANIPLMVVKSYGFIGYIRLQINEHTIIESHPDDELNDFRLDCPFEGLINFMDGQDLSTMSKQQHSHTPYLVILYKFLQKWKEENGGFPKTYREKMQFKKFIEDGKLKNEHGIPEVEENFDEAIAAVNTALTHYRIPEEVQNVLLDSKCSNISSKSKDFWIIANAVKEFVKENSTSEDNGLNDGQLPIGGKIPDMFSDSDRYVQLQNVYREKANQDAKDIFQKVQELLETIGRSPESINESVVKRFCKDAHHLRLVRGGSSIEEEYLGKSVNAPEVANHFEQDPESPARYYFILRGVEKFLANHCVLPGASATDVEPDIGKLKICVGNVLNEYPLAQNVCRDDDIHEVCRYGGAELHSMASIIGGAAAHEAVKVITSQYVPINNLFVYNSMTSTTVTLKV